MNMLWIILFYYGCSSMVSENKNIPSVSGETGCSYQNSSSDLGVGILAWENDCDHSLVIYSEQELKNKVTEFNICTDTIKVCPLFFKPDYGIFHFVLLKQEKKSYKIIYNDNSIGYIAMEPAWRFAPWDSFLKNESTSVRIKDSNQIYQVQKVSGDYIDLITEDGVITRNIRWRKNNEIWIEIQLLI